MELDVWGECNDIISLIGFCLNRYSELVNDLVSVMRNVKYDESGRCMWVRI